MLTDFQICEMNNCYVKEGPIPCNNGKGCHSLQEIRLIVKEQERATAKEIFDAIGKHDLVYFPKPFEFIHLEDTEEYKALKEKYGV